MTEDEPALRSITCELLRNFGYEILEAETPEEAIRLADEDPGRIDLLLTDVLMPRLRGNEVARKVREARPEVRVLYVSGYSDDSELRGEIASGLSFFLPKPFTARDLQQAVGRALASPRVGER